MKVVLADRTGGMFEVSAQDVPRYQVQEVQGMLTDFMLGKQSKFDRNALKAAVKEMATPQFGATGLGKIPCIKVVRILTDLGLREAKELVEEVQREHELCL